jgi:DNA-binding XRE family transcriptional regulator
MIQGLLLIKIDRPILTGHYSACYLLVMDNKIKIGRKLVQMRKAAGLTQDELSEASGISQGHISHIERSGEISSIEHLRGLAAVFNIEPGTLLNQLLEK